MPFFLNEPHATHKATSHPPILEQKGRFFFFDGVELNIGQAKKMLSWHEGICKRMGWKKTTRNSWEGTKPWTKQITPDM